MILTLLAMVLAQAEPVLETEFRELSTGNPDRAILLLHGLTPHPFSDSKANSPLSPSWLEADSRMGEGLSKKGSLYAFSYSQNVPVSQIASTLAPLVKDLREMKYKEIILVGFSAGALVVRQFVEDFPDAGVTRVIQVSPPNGGSSWGKIARMVRESQEVFVRSLSEESRAAFLSARAKKGIKIPKKTEFVVVMGRLVGFGDTAVDPGAQWPEGLRKQGVPVHSIGGVHSFAMRTKVCTELLAKLVSNPQPRWSKEKIEEAKKKLID